MQRISPYISQITVISIVVNDFEDILKQKASEAAVQIKYQELVLKVLTLDMKI